MYRNALWAHLRLNGGGDRQQDGYYWLACRGAGCTEQSVPLTIQDIRNYTALVAASEDDASAWLSPGKLEDSNFDQLFGFPTWEALCHSRSILIHGSYKEMVAECKRLASDESVVGCQILSKEKTDER